MSNPQVEPGRFNEKDAEEIARETFGVGASAKALPSYIDQNFRLEDDSGIAHMLKISNAAEPEEILELQNRTMDYLSKGYKRVECPRVIPSKSNARITTVGGPDGERRFARMVTYLEGDFLSEVKHTDRLMEELGTVFGEMDKVLLGFSHPAATRYLRWDLRHLFDIRDYLQYIPDIQRRRMVEYFLMQLETFVWPLLPGLRSSVIHNDGNDNNVITRPDESGEIRITGVIDFGDMVQTYTVCELAIVIAYGILEKADPFGQACLIARGYHRALPLTERELDVLFGLVCARLCMSVAISAFAKRMDPDNPYIEVSEKKAWSMLDHLIRIDPDAACDAFRQACGLASRSGRELQTGTQILSLRQRHMGPSLSVSYNAPLKIVRGFMQYLYDDQGRVFLDGVNNVCHVGHCHPKVVRAAQRQAAILNTNTRYLHDNIVEYAEQICSTMPEPLSVCFFVNSGSEANELALRLAKAHTGQRDLIVVDGAYHGNTGALVEISPYKFDGPGGSGAPPHVHKVVMPDCYRQAYKRDDPKAARKYAGHVREALLNIEGNGRKAAAFICESLLGCGGQIVLPKDYLKEAYRHVRQAGGVCIADEVQVGFGRVGTHMWGFQTQQVVPDIVTLGKPMGNGHPVAAVITTPQIAGSFANGMEYFNTYGGNPVSCAVGLSVLDVIKEEKLQKNALDVGTRLKADLDNLMSRHPIIGDVRGLGLFIGAELVRDRKTLTPAAEEASHIIEKMKDRGILLSTDGPLHNVLKIKPPLTFSKENAVFLVETLDEILTSRDWER